MVTHVRKNLGHQTRYLWFKNLVCFESLVNRHYSCWDYALQITGSFENICGGIRAHLKVTALSESGIVILALFWDVNRKHFRNAGVIIYYFLRFGPVKKCWDDHTVCLKWPQWRIQDFPERGAPTPKVETQTYYFGHSPPKTPWTFFENWVDVGTCISKLGRGCPIWGGQKSCLKSQTHICIKDMKSPTFVMHNWNFQEGIGTTRTPCHFGIFNKGEEGVFFAL